MGLDLKKNEIAPSRTPCALAPRRAMGEFRLMVAIQTASNFSALPTIAQVIGGEPVGASQITLVTSRRRNFADAD